MVSIYSKTARIATCLMVCCLICLAHKILLKKRYEGVHFDKRPVNYKIAYRNRNIASVYEDISSAGDGRIQPVNISFVDSSIADDLNQSPEVFIRKPQSNSFQDTITIHDVYISVKTSKKFHTSRLQLIINTWFQQAKNQTFFFTDTDDEKLDQLTGYHMINTGCKDSHTRNDLSCKMSAEYDGFMDSDKKWWCHLDDDNYVNVNRLVELLRQYKWTEDVYLGKASLKHPFHVMFQNKKEEFWFATGGAGVCITRTLAHKMAPWCRNGELARTSDHIRVPDDCTIGFVVTNRLGVELTKSNLLHSHLESLGIIDISTIDKQVTFSYRLNEVNSRSNVINVPESVVDPATDPTRLLYIHCLLNPGATACK